MIFFMSESFSSKVPPPRPPGLCHKSFDNWLMKLIKFHDPEMYVFLIQIFEIVVGILQFFNGSTLTSLAGQQSTVITLPSASFKAEVLNSL